MYWKRGHSCPAASQLKQAEPETSVQVAALKKWLQETHNQSQQQFKLDMKAGLYSSTEDFCSTEDVQAGEVGISVL